MENNRRQARDKSPVFVVGCHRSGTNLLYDLLLSAGGFAVYRGLLPVYEKLIPHFGNLEKLETRTKAVELFLRSEGFRRSGLNPEEVTAKLLSACRTGGDFLRIVMDEVARTQGATRWAVYNPDNVLRMARIKREIPDALFVHMIRDGRDIALSLSKMGGFTPLPWDRRSRALPATALYWEWMVRRGQRAGRNLGADYIEVHYEKLVSERDTTLQRLSQFLDHDLDSERIHKAGLGRLTETNSSFRDGRGKIEGSPVNRWKEKLSREEVAGLEALVSECLLELGYGLTIPESERRPGLKEKWMRITYCNMLNTKLWLKTNTPVGRLASLSQLELSDSAPAQESTQVP